MESIEQNFVLYITLAQRKNVKSLCQKLLRKLVRLFVTEK